MNIEAWKRRYTVREFDWDQTPDREKIDHLGNIIKHIPLIEGQTDHLWFELGPDDHQIKEWLVKHIFIRFSNNLGIKENMLPIVNAPYVFLAYVYDTGKGVNNKRIYTNIGFHAGALLAESLNIGLDVSQIGCNQGVTKKYTQEYKNNISECKQIFVDRFTTSEFDLEKLLWPELAICVGKGLPISEGYLKYKDMTWNKGKKPGKTKDNMLR